MLLLSDKNSASDSFGLISLCSIGPILCVLLLGIIYKHAAHQQNCPEEKEYQRARVQGGDGDGQEENNVLYSIAISFILLSLIAKLCIHYISFDREIQSLFSAPPSVK